MSLRRKILLVVLALLLLAPGALVYWVVTTESGLQFVARRLGKIGPVTITVGQVEGTLATGVRLQSLRIQHRRSDVQIEGIRGKVELWPLLLKQRISVPELAVDHVAVILFRDPDNHHPWTPRFLPSMLRIDAAAVRVAKADVTLFNGHVLHADNVAGAATLYPKQIRIHSGRLDYDVTHIEATGRILAALPIGLEGDINALYKPRGLPEWAVTTHIDGDLDELPVTARIARPFHAGITGAVRTLGSAWNFKGAGVVQDFDLRPFGGGNALGIISGKLALAANGDGFTANGALNPAGLKAGPLAVDFNGTYADRHLTIRQASARHAASGARATTRGGVDIVTGGPKLALTGEWTQFRWPLASATPAFTSPRGHYTISDIKPWQLHAQGEVVAAGLPAIPASLSGALAGDALRIDTASAQLAGGTATFSGETRWSPAESWRVEGHMKELNPAALRSDLPGRLAFDFNARGAPFGADATIDLDLHNLAGQLRRQNAGGKGHFARQAGSDNWQFSQVDLRFGRTRIQLNGGLGRQRDLQFALDADDLSLLDPDASGHVSARGRYAGTDTAPLLLFKARGSDFQWKAQSLAALDADVDIDLAGSGRTQGQINLTGLKIAGRTAQQLGIELAGNNAAQRITLDVEAAPLHSALIAQGVFQNGIWKGLVQNLAIDDAHNLHLKLETPAPLQFNLQQLRLDRLCLKGTEERLCAAGERNVNADWNAAFSAESLPLLALTAGLTQNIDYEGTINLQGELSAAARAQVTGTVRGQLQQAQLRHRLGNGRDERLSLGSGSINATATASDFTVQVGLDAGASGKFRGELRGERATADWLDYPIKGNLDATTDGLGLLDIYVGGIDKASGRLTTRIDVGGTLGRPEMQGSVQLRDAAIDIYQVNLSLRALQLDAKFNNEALDLSGQSRVGEGTAKFNGKLAWRKGEPYGDLHVEGENLRVVNVPEARIDASPKLDFKLDGRRIDATGEVRIPYARLEPADLTNAVLPSSDEAMVGAPVVDPSQRWIVVSDIRMVLGDQVNLDTLGLTEKLGGNITVRRDESQIDRGQGELNIVEGKYSALGRRLDIERGRLIFTNGPIGDPGIDLRAQKVYPDITAGVNVRGRLRAPRLTFFSEPSIPQSQIASLILAGGSLESVQNSSRPGAARNDLLAQGGAILAQQVGSHIGVDDVGIESDLNNETSLVVGKYLSSHWYVSYGISLAEAIYTLKLRYTIGDRWTIKTEAGKERSADIVYTIRR